MTRLIQLVFACFILLVGNAGTVSAQGKKGSFSQNSLGIAPPSGDYEGNVADEDKYKEVTNLFCKYVRAKQNDKALQFLNAGAAPLPMRFGQENWIVYTLIDQKNYQILDALYAKFPKMFRFSQAIHYACAKSDSEMIDYLIEHGASLDLNGGFTGGTYMKNSFQRERYEWNKDGRLKYLPCDNAIYNGNFDNLNYIAKKYNKFPSTTGLTEAVFNFMKKDNVEAVKMIMDMPNFDPNAVHGNGQISLLCLALEKDNKEIARILIEKGANVNHTYWHSSDGTLCPLLLVVKKPNMQDMLELLLSKGANPEYRDGNRGTFNVFKRARSEYKEWYILQGHSL